MKTLDCDKDLIRHADGFPGASTFVTYRWRAPTTCGRLAELITQRKARRSRRMGSSCVAVAALMTWVCGPIMR